MIYKDTLNTIGESKELYKGLVVKNGENITIDTQMEFLAPKTYGNTVIKAVVMDGGRLELKGRLKIGPEAVNCEAFLKLNVLLLGENATAVAVPDLEIETNEVKASHAATVGQINEEELFYLMSRGIPEKTAKEMIVESFFEEIFSKISYEEREAILKQL